MTTGSRAPTRSASEASEVDRTAGCGYYKVATNALNLFKEPGSGSDFVGQLKKNAIVCAARDQERGSVVWTYVLYELEGQNRRTTTVGWVMKSSLMPATGAELAALGVSIRGDASPAPPPAAPPSGPPQAAPPPAGPPPAPEPRTAADDVVRFSEPITFGPFPVNGKSLEQLIAGIPMLRRPRRKDLEGHLQPLPQVGQADAVHAGPGLRQRSERHDADSAPLRRPGKDRDDEMGPRWLPIRRLPMMWSIEGNEVHRCALV
jgi:hypothetical protein